MKKWLILISFLTLFFITACSGSNNQTDNTMPEFIDVQIIMPEEIQTGEPVQIKCLVTQGDEKVNDADEVEFELWKDGDPEDKHKSIEGTLEGEGIYYFEHTFDEPGTYFVISHVTAREYHIMPQQEFEVIE
ncbi:MAG: FixH family protein [Bacillaceae bacterium]|nr:FixH family protein [Bacillaceae bacterium]